MTKKEDSHYFRGERISQIIREILYKIEKCSVLGYTVQRTESKHFMTTLCSHMRSGY